MKKTELNSKKAQVKKESKITKKAQQVKEENKMDFTAMTTAEVLASVDAGDYEVDNDNEVLTTDYTFDSDENEDDELVDEPVVVEKAAKKNQKKAEQKACWLKNAKVTNDGKYQIVIDLDLEHRGTHKSWTPYAWVVNNDVTKTRIAWKFAIELAQEGKAVEITATELGEMVKAAKEAKKAVKDTADKAEESAAKAA